jgi:hypothetical protein
MAFRRKPMRFIPSKIAIKRHAERIVDMIHRLVRAVALGAIAASGCDDPRHSRCGQDRMN